MRENRAQRYLDALRTRVLVYDGAMGTSLQKMNLTADDFGGAAYEGCNDYLVITRPDVVERVHRSYLDVGADVIETDTFRSNRITLKEYNLHEQVLEINRAAAALARRLADEYSTPEKPRFVAGSIGPSGMLPSANDPVLSNITYGELVDVFREQAVGLLLGGVDVLLIETSQDILEVKAAIEGLKRAMQETGIRAAIQAQVTLDTTGRMLLGTDISAALAILEPLGIDAIGLNCSTGPDYMREPIRYLTSHTHLPVSAIPNAGLPLNVDGEAVYPMQPEPMAEMLLQFVNEFGCNIIGGCCGTTPEHIRLLVEGVQGVNPWARRPAEIDTTPRVASAMRATDIKQIPAPTLVGERVNSQGSRKVKRLLLEENYDALLEIAHEQVEGGAHMLDVCVALTERTDEAEQMRRLVKLLSQSVDVPLMIDSTEADVIRVALETYPGRAIVNSINMENGRQRIEEVLPLVKQHGAAVVALTIDEEGMAHTAERKFQIAKRMYDIATQEYGLPPEALIFDVLTFPITTGQAELRRAAIETLEGIRRIKAELPGVFTLLGVSNVSFGLKPAARAVLNSVFLHHAVEAGLDMAIVNPKHITPYFEIPEEQRTLMDDLIFDRREDALARVIQFFEENEIAVSGDERVDPTEGMSVEEKLYWYIVHRKKEGVEDLVDEAVQRHDPVWVLNNVMLPAMKEVGDKFGAGELILPFVLQSAEVMKKAVARLETYLERKEGTSKGTVVLATVFGDVHDIGKNLVGTILSNNGYTVVDLGKQVPVNTIIDAAVEHNAVAIGLSALLVSTSKQMPICVQELHKRGLSFPVLVGGAAINRRFGYRIMFMDDGSVYEPGVFYCKDAFEGLAVVDKLTGDPEERAAFVAEVKAKARRTLERGVVAATPAPAEAPAERTVPPAPDVPTPPFWGTRLVARDEIDVREVVSCFDLDTLYRLHWGGRGKRGEEWDELVATVFEPTLQRLTDELIETGWLSFGALYGYFPVAADGDTLIVFDPEDHTREVARLTFPRQSDRQRLCLADYFVPVREGRDVAALQLVTAGPEATRRMEALQAEGKYTEAYFINGFADQLAEGLAEWTHRRIRRELGLDEGRGLRYSWGYPACPDLSQHEDVMRLLGGERLGVRLSSGYQLIPEQSTAAIVVHHPEAIYFSTGIERRQQEEAIREVLGDLHLDE
ncbi:methionine synthase [Ardenticatena maritima]|uniref:Methionine synthase n=3 Tax=Ardenticatena maritima TaxID=872965 RepID=A0A0P6YMQ4_9CHLR|nr:methionine synthase [Ardenticatena maritima]KPL86548.1 methionine synthase [Ardenticatena maritima]